MPETPNCDDCEERLCRLDPNACAQEVDDVDRTLDGLEERIVGVESAFERFAEEDRQGPKSKDLIPTGGGGHWYHR